MENTFYEKMFASILSHLDYGTFYLLDFFFSACNIYILNEESGYMMTLEAHDAFFILPS